MLYTRRTLLTSARAAYTSRVLGTAASYLTAYWPLADVSGGVAADESGNGRVGAYSSVTLGQSGIGDGRTSASFNGLSSVCNIYSASLAAAWNGAEGTLLVWLAAAPSDAVTRTIAIFQASSSNNRVLLDKPSTGGIRARYAAGGVAMAPTAASAPSDWTSVVLTWSKAADDLRFYVGGVLISQLASLGTWSGALVSTTVNIGASTSLGTVVWADRLAHVALWNTALTFAQIAPVATL